jgi:hypothetical protein
MGRLDDEVAVFTGGSSGSLIRGGANVLAPREAPAGRKG